MYTKLKQCLGRMKKWRKIIFWRQNELSNCYHKAGLRRSSKLTHEQIAKQIGTSRSRINRIANHVENNVSFELLIKVISVLEVTPHDYMKHIRQELNKGHPEADLENIIQLGHTKSDLNMV